jgi:hypothetical protein
MDCSDICNCEGGACDEYQPPHITPDEMTAMRKSMSDAAIKRFAVSREYMIEFGNSLENHRLQADRHAIDLKDDQCGPYLRKRVTEDEFRHGGDIFLKKQRVESGDASRNKDRVDQVVRAKSRVGQLDNLGGEEFEPDAIRHRIDAEDRLRAYKQKFLPQYLIELDEAAERRSAFTSLIEKHEYMDALRHTAADNYLRSHDPNGGRYLHSLFPEQKLSMHGNKR